MTTRILLLPALLLLAVAAAPGSAQEGVVREHTIYLHENPLHIAPEQINARAGDTVQARIVNTAGNAEHDLVFCRSGAQASGACAQSWAATSRLAGGAEETVTFTVDAAGEFEFFCTLPGHKAGGMTGRLVVQGPPPEEKKGVPALGAVAALAVLAAAAWTRDRVR